jgi:GTP-binding protein EngB required for normal cell division
VITNDEYLAALISEEATRSATLALMKEDKIPKNATDVDRQIWAVAEELGLRERWKQGQDLIKQTKSREHAEVERAIQLYRKPIEDDRD